VTQSESAQIGALTEAVDTLKIQSEKQFDMLHDINRELSGMRLLLEQKVSQQESKFVQREEFDKRIRGIIGWQITLVTAFGLAFVAAIVDLIKNQLGWWKR
jgi:hypothetical protein